MEFGTILMGAGIGAVVGVLWVVIKALVTKKKESPKNEESKEE